METANRLASLNQRIKNLVDKCQDLEPPLVPPPLTNDDLMGLTPLSEEIYLSSINRREKQNLVKCGAYVPEDLIQYVKAWLRYQQEMRGIRDGVGTILGQSVVSWWRVNKRKLVKGKGIKLPDWQCKIIHSEYATHMEQIFFYLPTEVHAELMTAIKNGHIYANWHKATLAAVSRVALQAHHAEHSKFLIRYMKENKWRVDFT